MSLAFGPCRNASESGARDSACSSFMRRKTGLSCRRTRIQSEMTSSTADSRKGTRQPQSANSPAGIVERTAVITASDRSSPAERHPGNPARVQPAAVRRGVLGDIDDGAAELAADREALQHAQHDQQDRRRDADLRPARQQPDPDGRDAP